MQIDELEQEIFDNFFKKSYRVHTIKNADYVYVGTINKFKKPEGIGRMVTSKNVVHEGSFKNGQATGYGRRLEPIGSMFLGLYKQGIRSGQGVLLDRHGVEKKGLWKHYTFDGKITYPKSDEDDYDNYSMKSFR